jgi:hypothetical protein
MSEVMIQQLPLFTHSNFVEVQERGVAYLEFVRWFARSFGFAVGTPPTTTPAVAAPATSPNAATAATATSVVTPVAELPQVLNVLSLPGFADPLAPTPAPVSVPTPTPVAASTPSAATPATPTTSGGSLLAQFGSIDEAKRFVTTAVAQFAQFFADALNPVNPRAQKLVQLPNGLDLDKWINAEPKDETDDIDDGYSLETGSSSGSRSSRSRYGDETSSSSRRSRRRSRGGADDDDEYVKKPLTPQEIEEAKQRVRSFLLLIIILL